MVVERIEARLSLAASQFQRTLDSAIGKLGDLEAKSGGVNKAIRGLALGGAAAAGAALGKSAQSFADFDAAMTESMAIMGDVSGEMEDKMAGAAREVARTTQHSAEDAAESYFFLASAGLDASESMEHIDDVANFAQAGMFDMAEATDILTDANSALGRETEEMVGLGDQLVQANQNANASVQQFGEALTNKAAPAMNRMGVESEEGIAALSVFADQGLKGRRAGTIFARTLEGLEKNARQNSDAFEELGVQVTDADGEMRPLQSIVSDMEGAFAGMSTEQKNAALEQMGFNRRSKQGIDLLMGNSDALGEYQSSLQDAGGSAQEVANNQMDTFSAQLGLLKDNLNDIAISIGSAVVPALNNLLQPVMDAVSAFADWAQEGQNAKLLAGALAAVLGGGLLSAVVGLSAPVLALAGVVATLAAAWKSNFAGIRDVTMMVIGGLMDRFKRFVGFVKPLVLEFVGRLKKGFRDFVAVVEPIIRGFIDEAIRLWGRLEPLVEQTARILADITAKISDALGWLEENVIRPFVETIKGLWEKHGQALVTETRETFDAIMAKVKPVMDTLLRIITDILAMLQEAWNKWGDEIKFVVKTAFDAIKLTIGTVMDGILTTIRTIMALIRGDWEEAWNLVKGFVKDAWNKIFEFVTGVLDDILGGIKSFIADAWQAFKDFFNDLIFGSLVKDAFNEIKNFIFGIFGDIKQFIKDILGKIYDIFFGTLGDILGSVKDKIGKAKNFISDKVGAAKDAVKDKMGAAKDAVKDSMGKAKDAVKDKMGKAKDAAVSAMGKMKDGLEDKLGKAEDAFRGAFDTIKGIAGSIKDKAQGAVDSARDALGKARDLAGDAADAASDAASAASDAASSAAGAARDAAGRAADAARDAIPGFATGGLVTGPTAAMIGEGQEDEAVLPLSKLQHMLDFVQGLAPEDVSRIQEAVESAVSDRPVRSDLDVAARGGDGRGDEAVVTELRALRDEVGGMNATIAGAEVEVTEDGLLRFVDGRIELQRERDSVSAFARGTRQ